MKRKILIKASAVFILISILCITIGMIPSQAASVSINTTKYPAYKEKLDAILAKHPNWKINFKYTGLEWNAVIEGEYRGNHGNPNSFSPTNLVPISSKYDGDWVCPTCGLDSHYDVSRDWRCASRQAISYQMDPRNFFTEGGMFQFLELTSTVGDKQTLKNMASGTIFAEDKYINAILEAAPRSGVSPYHILSRIIQEQGASGTLFSRGEGYKGQYVGVYNFFNIGVSGNSDAGIIAGLKYAADRGWNTIEKAIEGGVSFIKKDYIDVGQSTLYFQKFNVVTKNPYQHQYMQNLFAAENEGLKIYKTFQSSGAINNALEFTIPVYENMSSTISVKPGNSSEKYSADINSEIKSLKLTTISGKPYLVGSAVIVEYLNGKTQIVPRAVPKIILKSTDGKVSYELYVKQESGNNYYFDRNMAGVDTSKSYYLYLSSGSSNNVSANKSQNMRFSNSTLGTIGSYTVKAYNNTVQFVEKDYKGDINTELKSLSLIENANKNKYISGNIVIVEWINGKANIPNPLPKIILKSTDGKVSYNCYVKQENGNTYYFDRNIQGIDKTKDYYLQVESTASNNVSTNKMQKVTLGTKNLGSYDSESKVITSGTTLQFTYTANIATDLKSFNVIKGSNNHKYISGNIVIIEWLNGKTSTVPRKLPKMTLKSTDGKINYECYLKQVNGNTYYFDRDIQNLDKSKTYYLEVASTSSNNVSTAKTQKVTLGTKDIVFEGSYHIKTSGTNMTFKNVNEYVGNINTELKTFKMAKNTKGANYVSGEIVVVEWVNGKSTVPKVAPKMKFKSTDGKVSMDVFVTATGTNTYYFDRFIEGIDTTKQYYFEVSSGDSNNVSTNKTMNVSFNANGLNNKVVGTYKGYKVTLSNQNIKFVADTYVGNINSELKTFKMAKNAAGANYVNGQIVVVEWVNGKSTVPKVAPKMKFKSTDGKVSMDVFVTATGTNTYYFDRFIEGIDTSKQYYFEVTSGDSKNVSKNKTMNVSFNANGLNNKVIGTYKNKKLTVKDTKMFFQ